MNITAEIGERIKASRKTKNLSQKQLSIIAFGSETGHEIISKVECGKRESVQFDTIYKILIALDMDLFRILDKFNSEK